MLSLANHKKCNKFIQIDQIIDSIKAADKKFMIQNTVIHLLRNPKLPCQFLKYQSFLLHQNQQKIIAFGNKCKTR
ncbi:hypothetical protein pb186bvf_006370 [Paramecium bursaria]